MIIEELRRWVLKDNTCRIEWQYVPNWKAKRHVLEDKTIGIELQGFVVRRKVGLVLLKIFSLQQIINTIPTSF